MSSLFLNPFDLSRVRPALEPAPNPWRLQDRIAFEILDGTLELEGEGGIASGPGAYREVVAEPPGRNPEGLTARLSLQALRFVQALGTRDAGILSRRLYRFNSLPGSPRYLRRVGRQSGFRHLLDMGSPALKPEKGWVRGEGGIGGGGWIAWRREGQPEAVTAPAPVYKLYISPRPTDLLHALEVSLPLLAEAGSMAVKVGSTLTEALRPDKMVAYFTNLEDLEGAAKALDPALDGVRPHGVPFSACLDGRGLLSWGMDPPRRGPGGERLSTRQSWRGWMTRSLGRWMRMVPPRGDGPEPWEFALTCLSLQGVDDETFAPSPAWRSAHLA